MWLVEEVPLVEFCKLHLDRVRQSGAKVMLLALVREADAPAFYEDLCRYWTSLDDVLNRHIMFAVAGGASRSLNASYGFWLDQADGNVAAHNPEFAIPLGRRHVANRDQIGYLEQAVRRTNEHANLRQSFHRRRLNEEQRREIPASSTEQVTELARHFGVEESDIPCVLVTLIKPDGQSTVALPLKLAGDFSIYQFCKDCAENFSSSFRAWQEAEVAMSVGRRDLSAQVTYDTAHSKIYELKQASLLIQNRFQNGARDDAEFQKQIQQLVQRLSSSQLMTTSIQNLLDKMSSESPRYQAKKHCFLAIEELQSSQEISKELASTLRRIAARAFSDDRRTFFFYGSEDGEETKRRADQELLEANVALVNLREAALTASRAWDNHVADCKRKIADAVEIAEKKLGSLRERVSQPAKERQWDYFISYASPDRDIALQVFRELQRGSNVFIDQQCLIPSDDWRTRLPTIQDQCHTTVALISHNTANAWYQQSEITRAIDLLRDRGHRILPLHLERGVPTPFGLERIHRIEPKTPNEDPISALRRHLESAAATANN